METKVEPAKDGNYGPRPQGLVEQSKDDGGYTPERLVIYHRRRQLTERSRAKFDWNLLAYLQRDVQEKDFVNSDECPSAWFNRELLMDRRMEIMFGMHGDQLAGFMCCLPKIGAIVHIETDKDYRRQGVARALVREFERNVVALANPKIKELTVGGTKLGDSEYVWLRLGFRKPLTAGQNWTRPLPAPQPQRVMVTDANGKQNGLLAAVVGRATKKKKKD